MLTIFFIAFVAFLFCSFIGYWYFVIQPTSQMQSYKLQFQQHGYKVKMLKYKPFGVATVAAVRQEYNKHGNCLKFYSDVCQGYDLLICNILRKVKIVAFNPELIQEFCTNQREWCYQKNYDVMSFLNRVSGPGLVTSQGESWKKKRKTMNVVFNYEFVSKLTNKIRKTCSKSLTICQNQANKDLPNLQYSVLKLNTDFAANVIFEGFLGGQLQKQKIQGQNPAYYLMDLVYGACEQFSDPVSLILGVKFLDKGLRKKDKLWNTKMQTFNCWGLNYIKKRIADQKKAAQQQREQYVSQDIISAMAFSHLNAKATSDFQYTQSDILCELKTFFIAGTDTTSHALQILIYYIFKDPLIQEKIRKQISERITSPEFRFEDIKDMKYLEAAEKEAIRLVGPGNATFPRIARVDHIFKGVKIHKGCAMSHSSISSHYSPLYFKDPEQFRPQRWLNGECDNLHPFAFCGFHGGPRACIGKGLARLQQKIAIIMLVQRYKNIQVLCQKLNIRNALVFEAKDFNLRLSN